MALYTETSYDDWARRQRQNLNNSAQNLQNKQAALQAAQAKPQKNTIESALTGLIGGLKERGSDILNTAKNVGKTVVGGINQLGANLEVKGDQKDDSKRRNEIAQKYGFKSYSEAANSGKASDDFWNEIKGNNEKTKERLKGNADTYRNNVGDVTKVNTNQAIGQGFNTIDTVLGFLPGGAGIAANIVGGGISGMGDEYKAAAAENRDVSWNNAKNNAIVGAVGGAAGSFVGDGLGKNAAKEGANALARLAGKNLIKGAASGAAAGAVGGGLGTYLNGGSLEDALLAAKEGATAGGISGGAMAGAMGLGGKALENLRNKRSGANTPKVSTPTEPVEATVVNKNRVEAPTAQRIEANSVIDTPTANNRRGIAITDLDAGVQDVKVRTSAPESRGKYIDSVVRRSDANLPEAKRLTYDERFGNLEGLGDKSLLDALNNPNSMYGNEGGYELLMGDLPKSLADRLKNATRDAASENSPYRAYEQYGISSQSDLPILNRDQYYYDNGGKLKSKGGTITAEDVPSYMQSHLREGGGRNNDVILNELFGDNMDLRDQYALYDEIAQTRNPETYTTKNMAQALYFDDQLRNDITRNIVDQYAPTQRIDIEKALTSEQALPVNQLRSNYTESTIPARNYNTEIARTPEAEVLPQPTANKSLATRQTAEPEISYNEQINRQKAQVAADKAKREAIGGVLSQYGTTRLSDRIEGLPNAIDDMLKLGLTSREEIDLYASKMTGKDSEIAKAIRKSLNDAGNTDVNLGVTMDDVFAASGAETAAQKKIQSFFDATSKKFKTDNGSMSRSDMYDFGKSLEKEGYKKYDRGVRNQNTTDQAYGEALIMLSEAAIGKATDGVDVSKNIDVNKLKAILPGNEVHAQRMEDLANNAKTVQDLRSAMSNATKLSLLKQAEEYNINSYGQNMGDAGKNAKGFFRGVKAAQSKDPFMAVVQAGTEAYYGSDKAKNKYIKKQYAKAQELQAQADGKAPIKKNTKASNIMDRIKNNSIGEKLGSIASNGAERLNNLNNETLANTQIGGLNNTGNMFRNQVNRQITRDQMNAQNEYRNNRAEAANAEADYNNALNSYNNEAQQVQAAEQLAQQQSGLGGQLGQIESAMQMALNAGDIKAYGQLADLYKQTAEIEQLKNPTSTGKALSASQSKALTAQQQLQQLAQMTPDARSAMANIPVLGKLVGATGGSEYDSQASALSSTLGYLLSGANIKEEEIARIQKEYIPTVYDSEAVRQSKLARAQDLINSYLADTSALQG